MTADPRAKKGEVKYGEIITHCNVPRSIALTYDDGPTDHTEELLDVLKNANVRATFFISGNSNGKGAIDTTERWIKVITRIVEEGHQVASHTWTHPDMDEIDSETRKDEMIKNERALSNILGKYPTYMRPPYLRCGNAAGGCLSDMNSLGYHVISYSHDSGDWLDANNLDQMKQRVDAAFAEVREDGNLLLIQHDTIKKAAIDLTKHILQNVQDRGWHGMYLPLLTLGSRIDVSHSHARGRLPWR